MSIRRSLTPWLACAAAIACASTAHARATPVEGYLRCVARERALPLRDAGAEAALLKLERYAICYRLNLAALAPCPPLPRADARQRARLRLAAAHAAVDAKEARALAPGLSGEEAAHALRVARDLDLQAVALQGHADAMDGEAGAPAACPARA